LLGIACPAENDSLGSIPIRSWEDIYKMSENLREIGVVKGEALAKHKAGQSTFILVREASHTPHDIVNSLT
jgi:hypothetical protein